MIYPTEESLQFPRPDTYLFRKRKGERENEKCEAPIADSNAGASLLLRAHKSSSQDGDVALNKGSQGARAYQEGRGQ